MSTDQKKGTEGPNEQEEQKDKFVSISTYARLCKVNIGTIYARLDKDDEKLLQLSRIPDVEGAFINTKIYPPKKFNPGWKKGRKRKPEKEPEIIIDIDHYVKITVELAHDHIKDISDEKVKKEAFAKFINERHSQIKDRISLEEFCKLIINLKS